MSGQRPVLLASLLAALIALAAWAAMTGKAAENPLQPNKPAAQANGQEANDDSDGAITPAEAEKAKAAALKIAGGGTVRDVEKGDDGDPGWYEVEILKSGAEIKVQLDASFNPRSGGEESEGSESEGAEEAEGTDDD